MELPENITTDILLAFKTVALERRRSLELPYKLWLELPKNIRESTAIWMEPFSHAKTSRQWVYDAGEGFINHGPAELIDYNRKYPSVQSLYETLEVADRYLSKDDKTAFVKGLGESGKHWTTLRELLPLSRLRSGTVVRYESLDWNGILHSKPAARAADLYLTYPGEAPILVEVKTRTTDVNFYFQQLANGVPEGLIRPRADFLLGDIFGKFPECSPSERLQGAWINISVPHALDDTVRSLGSCPSKIHFIIHYYGDGIARVAGRSKEIELQVCKVFGFTFRETD